MSYNFGEKYVVKHASTPKKNQRKNTKNHRKTFGDCNETLARKNTLLKHEENGGNNAEK